MIDLTNCKEIVNTFGGSEKKMAVLYNDKKYMVKFPDPVREKNNDLSYMNNQFSEHIGCKIFQSIGINAQNTFLAKFTEKDGKTKIVVACEDFCVGEKHLSEFSKLLLSDRSSNQKRKISIEDVMTAIDNIPVLNEKKGLNTELKSKFWDMFVVDGLIGNNDRHLDNWGVVFSDNKIDFAPIYDCGSALSPLLSDELMKTALEDPTELKSIEFNIHSVYSYKGERVLYHSIFKNPPVGLKAAIARIVPRIDMNKIYKIVNNVEDMSDTRKKYLNKALTLRYDKILLPALKKQRNYSR